MRLCPLCSGSNGNSTYVGVSDACGVLVDLGKSTKQIEILLKKNNIDINNIKSIFITHEHVDHISGIKVFTKKYGTKIYGSEGTINALKSKGIITENVNYEIIYDREIDLGFLSVKPFYTSHDCSQSMGYVLTAPNGKKTAVCTDLGYISSKVRQSVLGCNSILIESNHDVKMLQNGPYPYYLKRRILSELGHLSNDACSEFLPELVERGARDIIISHLSEKNNIPELAYQTAICNFEKHSMKEKTDFKLFVAPKLNDGKVNVTV